VRLDTIPVDRKAGTFAGKCGDRMTWRNGVSRVFRSFFGPVGGALAVLPVAYLSHVSLGLGIEGSVAGGLQAYVALVMSGVMVEGMFSADPPAAGGRPVLVVAALPAFAACAVTFHLMMRWGNYWLTSVSLLDCVVGVILLAELRTDYGRALIGTLLSGITLELFVLTRDPRHLLYCAIAAVMTIGFASRSWRKTGRATSSQPHSS
jgi:hypothetical protein